MSCVAAQRRIRRHMLILTAIIRSQRELIVRVGHVLGCDVVLGFLPVVLIQAELFGVGAVLLTLDSVRGRIRRVSLLLHGGIPHLPRNSGRISVSIPIDGVGLREMVIAVVRDVVLRMLRDLDIAVIRQKAA